MLDQFSLPSIISDQEKYGPSGGWYIFGNNRLILGPDHTDKTGWGAKKPIRIPEYHPQFYRFRGFVFLSAEDPRELPWNTSKTNMDLDSPIYRTVLQQMIVMMRNVIDFLNRLHDERNHFEKGLIKTLPLQKSIENTTSYELNTVVATKKHTVKEVFSYPEPAERVTMRKIREILRLVWLCGQSRRDTARTCGVCKSTVDAMISRATAAGFSWPLPSDLDDEALERRLYPPVVALTHRKLSPPDWQSLHDELANNKHLTLMLLWQEYKEGTPSGYQYSQYCELYRQWRKKLDRSMRQEHRAGEKFFVDYSGQTVPIVDAATGEIRQAQMFVGVMGNSNQTYAEVTWTQSLADWTGSHARAFAYLGAVPRCLVPDNLLAAVTKTCRYEPEVNPTYAELADHYGTAVVPARVRRPKDKAKVEGGVLIAQRFILAGLRHRREGARQAEARQRAVVAAAPVIAGDSGKGEARLVGVVEAGHGLGFAEAGAAQPVSHVGTRFTTGTHSVTVFGTHT